jgi:hypothetical protein
MKKIRPMGEIISDLEPLLMELVDIHDLQRGDIMALIFNYINVHLPQSIEIYEADGSSPEYKYGPKE